MTNYVINGTNKKQVNKDVVNALIVTGAPVYVFDQELEPYILTGIRRDKYTSSGFIFTAKKPGQKRNTETWILEAGDRVVIGYKWASKEAMIENINQLKADVLTKKMTYNHNRLPK